MSSRRSQERLVRRRSSSERAGTVRSRDPGRRGCTRDLHGKPRPGSCDFRRCFLSSCGGQVARDDRGGVRAVPEHDSNARARRAAPGGATSPGSRAAPVIPCSRWPPRAPGSWVSARRAATSSGFSPAVPTHRGRRDLRTTVPADHRFSYLRKFDTLFRKPLRLSPCRFRKRRLRTFAARSIQRFWIASLPKPAVAPWKGGGLRSSSTAPHGRSPANRPGNTWPPAPGASCRRSHAVAGSLSTPLLVRGWNDAELSPAHRIVGLASRTVTVPHADPLDPEEAFGIEARLLQRGLTLTPTPHRLADVPLTDKAPRAGPRRRTRHSAGVAVGTDARAKPLPRSLRKADGLRPWTFRLPTARWWTSMRGYSEDVTPARHRRRGARRGGRALEGDRRLRRRSRSRSSRATSRGAFTPCMFDVPATMILGHTASRRPSPGSMRMGVRDPDRGIVSELARFESGPGLAGSAQVTSDRRVGINGLGGSTTVFGSLASRPSVEVVGVNATCSAPTSSLISCQYDTVMGRYLRVAAEKDALGRQGRRIALARRRDPAKIPWRRVGARRSSSKARARSASAPRSEKNISAAPSA